MNQGSYKILSIVGARPNFIKLAPLSAALADAGFFEEIIVHTGQHYDATLSDAIFKELEIPSPKYNLEIGSGRQAWQLGMMIMQIDKVIEIEKPDAVLVFGDTNSTAAGAIAAAKNQVSVAHIEAGLREFDKSIPEEVNKLMTTAVADVYFCPTLTGVKNLAAFGIKHHVHLTGDVGIDLILKHLKKIEAEKNAVLQRFNISAKAYYFMTCHRASNTDCLENLAEILAALARFDLPVIFPLHPRTAKAIEKYHLPSPYTFPHVQVTLPLTFLETQILVRNAKAVITDSGGIVKEAYFHKTPGVIVDAQTEWIETVNEGWNTIAGPHQEKILSCLGKLNLPKTHSNCLGDGTASVKIALILTQFLSERAEKR